MNAPVDLNARDIEMFLLAVGGARRCTRRSDFQLWATGALQGLLPHNMLLCALGNANQSGWWVDRFSAFPFDDVLFENVRIPGTGFVARLVEEWRRRGRPMLASAAGESAADSRWAPELRRLGFANFACHGLLGARGEVQCHFILLGLPEPLDQRTHDLLELLTPHIYAAITRAVAGESTRAPVATGTLLTDREIEVLLWVQCGKSNAEIGSILAVSPLTVKNHVQRILRKLNAQNRAQAVAFGIGMGVLNPRPEPR